MYKWILLNIVTTTRFDRLAAIIASRTRSSPSWLTNVLTYTRSSSVLMIRLRRYLILSSVIDSTLRINGPHRCSRISGWWIASIKLMDVVYRVCTCHHVCSMNILDYVREAGMIYFSQVDTSPWLGYWVPLGRKINTPLSAESWRTLYWLSVDRVSIALVLCVLGEQIIS